MSSISLITKNTLSLLSAQVLGKVVSFLFTVYITRYFRPDLYGKFITISSLLLLFGTLSDFGLSTLFTRDIAKDRSLAGSYLKHGLWLRVPFATLSLGAMLITAKAMGYSHEMMIWTFLAGLSFFPAALAAPFVSCLSAFEEMLTLSLWGLLTGFLSVVLGIAALQTGLGLEGVFLAQGVSGMVYLVGVWSAVRSLKVRVEGTLQRALLRQILRNSLFFAVMGLLGISYVKLDILIVSQLAGEQAVAWYGAAFRLLEFLLFIPGSLMGAMFPVMSHYHRVSLSQLDSLYCGALRVMILLAFPIAIGTTLLAKPLVVFFYGPSFLPSAPAVSILAWALLLGFISYPACNLILSSERVFESLPFFFLLTLLKISLAFACIYQWGYLGACLAVVIGEVANFSMYLYFLTLILGRIPPFLRMCVRPFLAATLMGGGILVLHSLNWLFLVPGAAVTYFMMLVVLRELKRDDFVQLFQRVPSRHS